MQRVTILQTLGKIRDRLEQHGPAWILKRVRFELATPTTMPGKAAALVASMEWMRACGCGLCRIRPTSMPGSTKSSV